jgi:hypothetical protein
MDKSMTAVKPYTAAASDLKGVPSVEVTLGVCLRLMEKVLPAVEEYI